MQKKFLKRLFGIAGFLSCTVLSANAQKTTLTLDLGKPGADVSPMLYGLMTEEINHSYDGGLYAELIRNRIFKDSKTMPEGWSLVKGNTADSADIKLMAANALIAAIAIGAAIGLVYASKPR